MAMSDGDGDGDGGGDGDGDGQWGRSGRRIGNGDGCVDQRVIVMMILSVIVWVPSCRESLLL